MIEHIRESNLIENIDDPKEDQQSLVAWKYIEAVKNINETNLLTLHKMITKDQLSKEESGHFRKIQVYVGDYIPPASTLVPHLIGNWLIDLKFLEKYTPKDMHIKFEKIHPFVDGNGRVGRMLMWWHEIQLGKPPTLIRSNEADRFEYYKWFRGNQ